MGPGLFSGAIAVSLREGLFKMIPLPSFVLRKGNPLISGKSKLVKYYYLARIYVQDVKMEVMINRDFFACFDAWHLPYNSTIDVKNMFLYGNPIP